MAAPATTRIGPYRIEREIARGGMGIVYLAQDTRLDRTVALKALPADVADDPERLHRFEREAKLLASLNHPNIAAIYDIAEGGGRRYLALEHVEGETLAQRLAGGALPVGEAVEICLQIASGMEAAHERGVIHRDLKPGNVMIGAGDQVKIVDFGLAKGRLAPEADVAQSPAWAPGGDAAGVPQSPTPLQSAPPTSPTITSPALAPGTIPGIILGTAPYLSPEQARGKAVDRRTDIWSWGCILYECLTAKRAFQGETVSDTVARILEREPDWSALPKATPPRVRELLRRSLEKDPRRRLRDMGEARLALEEVRAGGTGSASTGAMAVDSTQAGARRGWFDRLPSGLMLAIGLILGGALALRMTGHPMPWESAGSGTGIVRGPVHLSVWIPSDLSAIKADLTPDGKTIVMRAVRGAREGGQGARPMLYTRRLDKRDFEPIRGSEGALGFVITPDGRRIGFGAPVAPRSSKVRAFLVPIDGSAPPAPLMDPGASWTNGTVWLESGDILAGLAGGLEYVRVNGKTLQVSGPRRFGGPASSAELSLISGLPHDRGVFLKSIFYRNGVYHEGVSVLDLKSGQSKTLVEDGSSPAYSPTGHFLFTRGGTLLAAPFDLNHLALTGEPTAILGGLRTSGFSWTGAEFDLSPAGTLLYALGDPIAMRRHVIVIDRNGAVTAWSDEHAPFKTDIVSSPDGSRIATILPNADGLDEVWISRRRAPSSQKLVAVPGNDCDSPRWSRDGSWIAYCQYSQSKGDGVYLVSAAGGTPRAVALVSSPGDVLLPNDWFPGGSRILCMRQRSGKRDLVTVDVGAPGSPPSGLKPLLIGSADYFQGDLSTDGRFLAYISNESGTREAFVREFESDGSLGPPLQISTQGAQFVAWERPGTTLGIIAPDRKAYEVTITAKPALAATSPRQIWDLEALGVTTYMIDPLPDGQAVAIQKGDDEDELTHFDITLNFLDELRARLKEKP